MRWHDDLATRTVYATDNSIYQVVPEAVVVPESIDDVVELLKSNHRSSQPRPIVARGGGTGTNGQSLTEGISLDLKRGLNRIVSVDPETRTATVQPGVVTAALNDAVKPHGLFWPPHTSTLNRATVGGMISTDAAGKGSLVYGRAHRHVDRLTIVLDDGSLFVAEPVSVAEAAQRAAMPGRAGDIWQSLIDFDAGDPAELGLPELARGFSGYGIDRLRDGDVIDPTALLCGAEGTLGVVVEATVRLAELPTATRLIVATYPSFDMALADAVELRELGPSAIETLDETTLQRGKASPAWPALSAAVGDHAGAVLLIEFATSANEAPDSSLALAALAQAERSEATAVIDDPEAQRSIWKIRADAVGLLAKESVGGPELSARPTAFVEDCAVPVEHMTNFIAEFRRVLDEAGLHYAMFGHADVGCVHVRPALDLSEPSQRALVETVTSEVMTLVDRYGGLLWGEHGRGFRGAHVDHVLPERTVALMRSIKSVFDPHDLFNPGKLYRPLGSTAPLVAVAEPPMRGAIDQLIDAGLKRDFDHAFACNGNGLCHHYHADEVMCPSYKATGDPALSPRGRVDLLRAWLVSDDVDETFADEVAANLDQCLSCSACSGHCPVEVDIPELKSRFLQRYYATRRRPIQHQLLARFESLAMLASRWPILGAGTSAGRLLGLVDLPRPVSVVAPSAQLLVPLHEADVVVLPDVFSASLEASLLADTVQVLAAVGYRVAVSSFAPSGKFDHVKGDRQRFAQTVHKQRAHVHAATARGAVATVIEPAIALLHHHEYREIDHTYPTDAVTPLSELIDARVEQLPRVAQGESVRLLGHCTERATAASSADGWIRVLEAAGYDVHAPNVGCCGMAGIFGHEAKNQQLSRSVWELSWPRHLEEAKRAGQAVVATGYSCRSQAKRFADAQLQHPITLIAQALAKAGHG